MPTTALSTPRPRPTRGGKGGKAGVVLGHFFVFGVEELVLLVVVGCDLDEPLRLDGEDHPHVLLGGEGELVEAEPLGRYVFVGHDGGGVDMDGVHVLDGFVLAGGRKLGGVVEVAGADGLGDVVDVGFLILLFLDVELDALAQGGELVADVSRAHHGPGLDVVFIAPLRRVVGVGPFVVDPEEGEVVAAAAAGEVELGVVRVDGPFLRSIENRVPRGEHRADFHNVADGVIFIGDDDGLGELGIAGKLRHAAAHFRKFAAVVQRAERVELLQGPDEHLCWGGVHEIEV
mmetsp:Transcript_4301/g.14272  ORF Transcript_4301/g.14272 Transcript_4301/m.14272 type:complete len:288 (-) Transcript_4301:1061-1924(-)